MERKIESEDYGTATWGYWQEIRNEEGARGSFRQATPLQRSRVSSIADVATGMGARHRRCRCGLPVGSLDVYRTQPLGHSVR